MFNKVGIMKKIRKDLISYGADIKGIAGEWAVSNRAIEDTKKRIRTTKISAEILDHLSSDVVTIELRLVLLAWGALMPIKTRRIFQQARRQPWRYKPPRPIARGRRRRKSPPKRQHQPSPLQP